MGLTWEITVVDGVEYRTLVFGSVESAAAVTEKPNRTTFCPDAVLRSLRNAKTPNGIEDATRAMRRHGLSPRDREYLLKKYAPYYRL
jgi:hypothetical protein